MLTLPKNNRALKVAVHILIWLILFIMPYLLSSNEQPEFSRVMRFSWIPMIFYACIFYTNYLLLIDKLLFQKKITVYILINIAIIILFTGLTFTVIHHLYAHNSFPKPPLGPHKNSKPFLGLFIYKDALSMLIPLIVSIAVKATEKWNKIEIEKKEAEHESLNSELQHLKYQLQPHFFFNSLNTIYSLIERSPQLAQETVHSLAKLMRYMLYETDHGKTSLVREIEFMDQYIGLMKLRITDKTKVKVDFPVLQQEYQIAPLLFISLIENGFKHGISSTQPSELSFTLFVNNSTVCFMASNTNFPKTDADKSGSGIGLYNIKKRLDLLYPNNYVFETRIEGHLFQSILTVNL